MPTLIAHRGNLDGPNPSRENHPDQIRVALGAGFDVEIDVWDQHGTLYLGHDEPTYTLPDQLLELPGLWIHCKNIPALVTLQNLFPNTHYFYHENDACTLTSRGFIWTYPGKFLTSNSVCVMPEIAVDSAFDLARVQGICTDYPASYE